MAISIRRGTTKTLMFTLDCCCNQEWADLGKVIVRLQQGSLVIDKELTVSESDPTAATVEYSQEETIQLNEGSPAEIQIFSINGTEKETALKSDVYEVKVLKSLWNEVVHNE